MKEVTTKEFLEFIFSQPRDKEVNMDQYESQDSCGCLAVQYTKKNFPHLTEFSCSGDDVSKIDINYSLRPHWRLSGLPEIRTNFFSFVPNNSIDIYTYGELQDYLKTVEWAIPLIPS